MSKEKQIMADHVNNLLNAARQLSPEKPVGKILLRKITDLHPEIKKLNKALKDDPALAGYEFYKFADHPGEELLHQHVKVWCCNPNCHWEDPEICYPGE